ncbi:MAG: class I SAM-dependent methyltransferase [Chloroflexota bacterium]
MALLEAACDLCGGTAFEVRYHATIPATSSDPALYYSSSRLHAGHLQIVRCQECGLVMTNPRDDPETLRQVYTALQDPVYDIEEHNRRRTALDHLKFVNRHLSPAARLLDVGCSTGFFLAEAQAAGWQVTGIEPSTWAAQLAQQRLPGAQIHPAALEEIDFAPQAFEAVTLWDVLEHVASPTQVLQRLEAWLSPGGWLFLNVPNIDSWQAHWMGRRWVLLLREHLWYYSPATLQATLAKTGFEMISVRPNYVWFSIENVLRRAAQYPGILKSSAQVFLKSDRLKRLSIHFAMGEMQVAARKQ